MAKSPVGVAILDNVAVIATDLTSPPFIIELDKEDRFEKAVIHLEAMKLYKRKLVIGLPDSMVQTTNMKILQDITSMKKYQRILLKELAKEAGYSPDLYSVAYKLLKTDYLPGKIIVSSARCEQGLITLLTDKLKDFNIVGIDTNIEALRRSIKESGDYLIIRTHSDKDNGYMEISLYRDDFILGSRTLNINNYDGMRIQVELFRTIGAIKNTLKDFAPKTGYLMAEDEAVATQIETFLDFETLNRFSLEDYQAALARGLILWVGEK